MSRAPHALAATLLALAATASPARAQPADALATITASAPSCPAGRTCVGIHLHVVVDGEQPVQDAAWIAQQLAEANRLFEPVGVGFELDAVDALDATLADVETRADRDRLGAGRYTRGVVHVFLVRKLANVDEEGVIRGVHWRWRKKTSSRWVILSSIAPPMVLAHELGHFFGLPHSTWDVSIMNKTPRAEPPYEQRRFHDEEVKTMKARAKAMVRSKELRDRKPATP